MGRAATPLTIMPTTPSLCLVHRIYARFGLRCPRQSGRLQEPRESRSASRFRRRNLLPGTRITTTHTDVSSLDFDAGQPSLTG